MATRTPPLKFVDLFSGLGGFHVALKRLGHHCVYASESDDKLRKLYYLNFGIEPDSDIRLNWQNVPEHDVLCAGFPCQPFSKAGAQYGFSCPISGDLFDYILKIIDFRTPKFLILENVPNIFRHAKGETWRRIKSSLNLRGYAVESREISPHQIGVPQIRTRAVIVASKPSLSGFQWPNLLSNDRTLHISSVLDTPSSCAKPLTETYLGYLDVWQEFLDRLGPEVKMPSFPIWAMEFSATYPYNHRSPVSFGQRYLARFQGGFGEKLSGRSREDQILTLPPYARSEKSFPKWKIKFIEQNRDFFLANEKKLRGWLPKVKSFPASFQKLEWNWQNGSRTIWDKVVQFRASGIRVKNPAAAPSLVALTTSQVPVVTWQKRYMTVRECAKLQSLEGLQYLPSTETQAFKSLGNAINADVVQVVAGQLLSLAFDASSASQCASVAAQHRDVVID